MYMYMYIHCTSACSPSLCILVCTCTCTHFCMLVVASVNSWLSPCNVQVIMNNQTLEDCPDIFGGGFGSDIEVNVGFIRQCYFNQIFDRVQEYDVYRYTHCSIGTCLLFSFIISVLHPHLHLSPPGVHTHLSSLSLPTQQVCTGYHHLLHGSVVGCADACGYCTGRGGLEEGPLSRQQN